MKNIFLQFLFALLFSCAVHADSFIIDPFNFAGPPVITHTDQTTCTNGLTTYSATCTGGSLTALSTGTADASRYTCITPVGGATANRTLSASTIDGNAMTAVVAAGASEAATGIHCLANPTGTTAAFTITFSGAAVRMGIDVWSITGLSSTTPTDTASGTASAVAAIATSTGMDISAGGLQLCVAGRRANTTFTWTNATENQDYAIASATTVTDAADSNSAGVSNATITATSVSSSNSGSISCASFR